MFKTLVAEVDGAVPDVSATEFDTVFCSGGRRGLEVEPAPADLAMATNATVVAIPAGRRCGPEAPTAPPRVPRYVVFVVDCVVCRKQTCRSVDPGRRGAVRSVRAVAHIPNARAGHEPH